MKILLINAGSLQVSQKPALPLGLLSIATYLTNRGHDVQLYDRAVEKGREKKYLDSFSPDIVGISAPSFKCYPDAIKISKIVRKKNVLVAWGGQIPSMIPDIILKSGAADFIVIGEGEITMLALVNSIIEKTSPHKIDGLAFIENGTPIINKNREFADLADLPIIDFKFVNCEKYYDRNIYCERMLHVYLSKGCTGHCTYCYSPSYSKCVWRYRPSEYYLSELSYLVENYKMDGVYFVDDLLSPNKEYLFGLCDKLIQSNLGIYWNCNMRADTCSKEELQKMYDAGCRWIFFGIESGFEQRQKSLKKG